MTEFERREDFLTVDDEFYVKATSSLADDRTRVLKYGETFAVFNRFGDIESVGTMQFGLFYREARHLSRLSFYLGGRKPLLLNSSIREDNSLLSVDATNLSVQLPDARHVPQGSIHIFRSTFLSDASCHVQFRLHNYGMETQPVDLLFVFDADFADIFQVRGTPRSHSGRRLEDRFDEQSLRLGYVGLDGVTRETRVSFSVRPEKTGPREAHFVHELAPHSDWSFSLTVTCERSDSDKPSNQHGSRSVAQDTSLFETHVVSSNKRFNSWLARFRTTARRIWHGWTDWRTACSAERRGCLHHTEVADLVSDCLTGCKDHLHLGWPASSKPFSGPANEMDSLGCLAVYWRHHFFRYHQ
jgi:glycogen debranching enzyme